jgi:SNF2 family DNA or RNA helicase
MTLALWKHQQLMVDWLLARGGGLIAAGMGSGKTAVAIVACRDRRAMLVCCPLAVGPAWKKQLNLWDTSRVFIDGVTGSAKARAERLRDAIASGRRFAFVTNYEAVWRPGLAELVAAVAWDAIVLDESHKIKAHNGRSSKWLAKLAQSKPSALRICMTGTPMGNSPLDIFGQSRFLDPSIYGSSYIRFRSRYADTDPRFPSKVRKYINQNEFTAKLDSFSYRVETDDVLDLPDAIHEEIPIVLSPLTRRKYDELERDAVTFLEDKGAVFTPHALTQLLRLAQCSGGYLPYDDTATGQRVHTLVDGMPAKAAALEEWFDGLDLREPVVVFCRFTADLEEILAAAKRAGRTVSELSGRVGALSRGKDGVGSLADWQAGVTDVIAVQVQSGGVGIDLTRSHYAVYYSQCWSLSDYEQSLARQRRPGQTQCVRYYHLVARGTVDETIYRALSSKRSIVESVMDSLTKRVEVGV